MRTAITYAKLPLILSALRRESMNVTSAKTIERMEPLAKKRVLARVPRAQTAKRLTLPVSGHFCY